MVTFLLGLPGSGKSYYAVDRIYNNFSVNDDAKKDKNATFKNCYTNIADFKFDKFTNVFNLDFDDLKSKLSELHAMYKKKCSDDELIDYLEENDIKDTLFVIDEAHNFFDVSNTVLIWWLSYHRHLYHEIILITQNISLIYSKYKSFSEFFYVARSSSLTLDKRFFVYIYYTNSRLSQSSKAGKVKIRKNYNVFDIYQSGDSVNASNIILKFLVISSSLFIVLLLFFYFFIYKKAPDAVSKKEEIQTQTIKPVNASFSPSVTPISTPFSSQKYFILICGFNKCYNDDISIPAKLFNIFLENKSILEYYRESLNSTTLKFYLHSSIDFYDFISNKKVEDEKNGLISSRSNFPVAVK